jgi:hypothetical protein
MAPELLIKIGVIKMDELIKEFSDFLADEYRYLNQVKVFLMGIPERISEGDTDHFEFQNFIEKYEVQNAHFLHEKNRFKERIGEQLNMKKEQVTFRLLVQLGHREFEETGRNVLKISNEITMLLLKISIFLRNFTKLQMEFKRLNGYLYQHDYSSRGMVVENSYHTGRNFHGEA